MGLMCPARSASHELQQWRHGAACRTLYLRKSGGNGLSCPAPPAGLSTYQALGHVDHFTVAGTALGGGGGNHQHLERAPALEGGTMFQPESIPGTRRPGPGVPQSRGGLAPAPASAYPSGVEPPLRPPCQPGALPVGCQPEEAMVAARNLGDDIVFKRKEIRDHPYGSPGSRLEFRSFP